MTWRPPSARDQPDDRFDRLHEGVPSWLVQPISRWVTEFFMFHPPMELEVHYDIAVIREIEMAVRFDPPLPWQDARSAAAAIIQRFHNGSPEAIDVLDFLLGRLPRLFSWDTWDNNASELKRILDAGSVWEVTTGEEGEKGARYRLTRRVAGPVVEAIEEIGSLSERAGVHLNDAWAQLLGANPDPKAAYRSAVEAVEVAAKPVISPNHAKTTLGTMRGDLKADPGKWTFELGEVELVVLPMVSALWDNQLRHADEAAALSETQEQADAAVHLAVTLVRWFTSGAIRRT